MSSRQEDKVIELLSELEKLSNEEFYIYLRECAIKGADHHVANANNIEIFRRVWVVGL